MAKQGLRVVEENGRRPSEDDPGDARLEELVAFGRAISDPIRVRMLGMMAEAAASGRGCCALPDLGVPAGEGEQGICVCEFQDRFSMGQSRVSYHVRKLKDAGLILEEKRGKWSFYSLDREAARRLLTDAAEHFGAEASSATGV
jgi:ArsR family transcriptional regulator